MISEICIWKWDVPQNIYYTECNSTFEFLEFGLKENDFVFCPFCGKPIEESKL
jgi:hypothetical protein